MTLGERLRELRTERGWSIREFAELLETSASQVQRLEAGGTKRPHPDTLWAIAYVGAVRLGAPATKRVQGARSELYAELMQLAGYYPRPTAVETPASPRSNS